MKRTHKKYYYYHAESDCVWWSFNPPHKEPNDGCVDPVSKKRAKELSKELGEDKISDGNFTKN